MKKLFVVLSLIISINMSAQVYGGFGCRDADAWFDKEIYFWCKHQMVNMYGYPMQISNVTLFADGIQYDLQGMWDFDTYIFLDAANGVDFHKGSVVSVYIGGQLWGTWRCDESNPTAMDVVKRAWSNKPKTKTNANGILKFIKRFRRI